MADRTTIDDIAAAAGVSTATVSRALRDLPGVAENTRERVRRIAAERHYELSPVAAVLAGRQSKSLAIITPKASGWYYTSIIAGIETTLRTTDRELILFSVGEPGGRSAASVLRQLRRRVGGAILVTLPMDAELSEALGEAGIPISMIGTREPGLPGVWIDDRHGASLAVRHLIGLGHQRIGLLCGSGDRPGFKVETNRAAAYEHELRAAGITPDPSLVANGEFDIDRAESAMAQLLALPKPPTAVFAMSDEMAFGAMRACHQRGIEVGRDISIVGFDDHDLARILDLTTVAQPVSQLAIAALDGLLATIDRPDEPPQQLQFDVHLVVRGSSAPPRS